MNQILNTVHIIFVPDNNIDIIMSWLSRHRDFVVTLLVPVAKTNLNQIAHRSCVKLKRSYFSRLGYSREYRGKWMFAEKSYWFTVFVRWYLCWLYSFFIFQMCFGKQKLLFFSNSFFRTVKFFKCFLFYDYIWILCAQIQNFF